MNKQTALYQQHLDAGARMVDFGGWDMPLHYGSQLAEHQQVREHAGVFDVSHMTVIDISGKQGRDFLRHLLSNDVDRLDAPGKAHYSLMLNEQGGVVDDLIVYRMQSGYRLVVNCATREKDLDWITRHASAFDVVISERPLLAILAVHGPESIERVCELLPSDLAEAVRALGYFQSLEMDDRLIARTGYTGEKGLELILPQAQVPKLWQQLLAAGVQPVGLGARDTLRLEAGMNLYGHDMDERTPALAANLLHAVALVPEDRNFIGRAAVTAQRNEQQAGSLPVLSGVVMEERGVLREGQKVLTDRGEGVLTSGCFSPTLKHAIGLARIPAGSSTAQVDIRGKLTPVRIIRPGFVRFGKKIFE